MLPTSQPTMSKDFDKVLKIHSHRRNGQELRGREISQKSESFSGEFHENSCMLLRTIFLRRGVP